MDVFIESVTFMMPIIILLGIGYVSSKTSYFPSDGIGDMMHFFMCFIVPAAMFLFIAPMPRHEIVSSGNFMLCMFLVNVIIMVFSYLLSRMQGFGHKNATVVSLCASMPNIGFVGLPIILSLPHSHHLIHYWLVSVLLAICLIAFVFEPSLQLGSKRLSIGSLMGGVLSSFKVPLVIASVVALAFSLLAIDLPPLPLKTLTIMSDALVGFGLICIGMGMTFKFLCSKSYWTWFLILFKGVLMPVIAYMIAHYFFDFTKEQLFIMVVLAGCPTAGVGVVLAHQYSDLGPDASQAMAGTVLTCLINLSLCYTFL